MSNILTFSSLIRLKEILEEQGRTNLWLAQKINKSENTVSRWCHNKVQPSIATLNQIAEILNVDVRELLKPAE